MLRCCAILLLAFGCDLPSPSARGSSAPAPAAYPLLSQLETHLIPGQTHAEGPGAALLLEGIEARLVEGDSAVVHVTPGQVRTVVLLVRYGSTGGYENLRDLEDAERREFLMGYLESLSVDLEPTDSIAIGLKGSLLYGATLTRIGGAPPVLNTGFTVDKAPLEAMLAAVPPPLAPGRPLGFEAPVEGQLAESAERFVLDLKDPALVRLSLDAETTETEQWGAYAAVCPGDVARINDCDFAEIDTSRDPYEIPSLRREYLRLGSSDDSSLRMLLHALPSGLNTVFVGVERNAEGPLGPLPSFRLAASLVPEP